MIYDLVDVIAISACCYILGLLTPSTIADRKTNKRANHPTNHKPKRINQ